MQLASDVKGLVTGQIFANLIPGLERIVHPNVAITDQEVIQLNDKMNNLTKGIPDFGTHLCCGVAKDVGAHARKVGRHREREGWKERGCPLTDIVIVFFNSSKTKMKSLACAGDLPPGAYYQYNGSVAIAENWFALQDAGHVYEPRLKPICLLLLFLLLLFQYMGCVRGSWDVYPVGLGCGTQCP